MLRALSVLHENHLQVGLVFRCASCCARHRAGRTWPSWSLTRQMLALTLQRRAALQELLTSSPWTTGSAVAWPLQPLPARLAGQPACAKTKAVSLPGGQANPGRLSPRRHSVPVQLGCQAGGHWRAANSRRAAQVAQLADEAAEAVHLLDGLDEQRRQAGLPLVLDALDKVAAKAEGLLRAGQGPLALEALVAVTGEVVRPDEVPRAPCTRAGTLRFFALLCWLPPGDLQLSRRD